MHVRKCRCVQCLCRPEGPDLPGAGGTGGCEPLSEQLLELSPLQEQYVFVNTQLSLQLYSEILCKVGVQYFWFFFHLCLPALKGYFQKMGTMEVKENAMWINFKISRKQLVKKKKVNSQAKCMAWWKNVCLANPRPWVRTSEWGSTKRSKSMPITAKLLKSKDKENFQSSQRKWPITYSRTVIRMRLEFSSERMEARRYWTL